MSIGWIAGLIGVYISFTLILIYVRDPSADEQSRHLEKVFFAATHVFIAIGLGCGLTLLGAAIAARIRAFLPGLVILLLLLAGVEILGAFGVEFFKAISAFRETSLPGARAAAVIGLALILALFVLAGWLLYSPRKSCTKATTTPTGGRARPTGPRPKRRPSVSASATGRTPSERRVCYLSRAHGSTGVGARELRRDRQVANDG